MIEHYHQSDIIIIGGGITGAALALSLSAYKGRIRILEKNRDIAAGATKANSGIVHGGYTSKAGTLKGELAIRGNRMYPHLASRLGFPYRQCGSLVLAFTQGDLATLEALKANGEQNGVQQLRLLTPQETLERESRINPAIKGALHCGETGIVSPYEAAQAFMEAALDSGALLSLNTPVNGLNKKGDLYHLTTPEGTYTAPVVINAAGIFADTIEAYLGLKSFTITPRKGEYLIYRRGAARGLNSVVFQPPTDKGKGILVTPTTWGNLMIGPNAQESPREDRQTTPEALKEILQQARQSVPDLTEKGIIRTFAGVRPSTIEKDFILGETPLPGFFNAAGIDSPGITAAPALAEKLTREMASKGYLGAPKKHYNPHRKAITQPTELRPPNQIKSDLDRDWDDPKKIICRCEQVRLETIQDALNRGIPLDSLDGVKRRTRAGMGACQGQFCAPRVTRVIKEATGLSEEEIEPAHHPDRSVLKDLKV